MSSSTLTIRKNSPTHLIERDAHPSLRYQPIFFILVLLLVLVLFRVVSIVGSLYVGFGNISVSSARLGLSEIGRATWRSSRL